MTPISPAIIDWSNIVVAGSAALLPLLSRRVDVKEHNDLTVESQAERYFQYLTTTPFPYPQKDFQWYSFCLLHSKQIWRNSHRKTASTSDIDIFIYGIDSEELAVKRIIEVERVVRKNQRLFTNEGLTLRSENAITFIAPRWPFRHVQVIRIS